MSQLNLCVLFALLAFAMAQQAQQMGPNWQQPLGHGVDGHQVPGLAGVNWDKSPMGQHDGNGTESSGQHESQVGMSSDGN